MTPLLLCTSILVVTLTASGIAKAKDPSSTVEGILNLGLDSVAPLKLTPAVLPWAELVLAAVRAHGVLPGGDRSGVGYRPHRRL